MNYWNTDQTKNRDFFDELVEASVNKGTLGNTVVNNRYRV
jgi:hypothetical protein